MAQPAGPALCEAPKTAAERDFCDEYEAASLPNPRDVSSVAPPRRKLVGRKAALVDAQRRMEIAVLAQYVQTPLTPANRDERIDDQVARRYVYDRISAPGIDILQSMRVGDDPGYFDLKYIGRMGHHLPVIGPRVHGELERATSGELLAPHKHSFYQCSGSFENLAARISKLIRNGLARDALKQLQNCQGVRQKPGSNKDDAHKAAIKMVAAAIVDLRGLIAAAERVGGAGAVVPNYQVTFTPDVGFFFVLQSDLRADVPAWRPQGARRRRTRRKNGRKRRNTMKRI